MILPPIEKSVEAGDIVIFSQDSCAWAFHCGLLDDHHGIGSLGLVVEASEEKQHLSVFLLDYHERLSAWDNCLVYGYCNETPNDTQQAAYDIHAVVTTSTPDRGYSRCMTKWISEDVTHSLYRIYFEKMMRAAQDELHIPDDIMREIREDTNDFDLGGWASVNCGRSEGTLRQVLDALDSALVHGVLHVKSDVRYWLDDKEAGDLDPEQLLDAIEAMQQDRDVRHKDGDRLLGVWGRRVNASGVRQGFAGGSCAEAFNGSQQ